MTTRSSRSKDPVKGDVKVTAEDGKIENILPTLEENKPEPVNIEVESPSEDPVPAPEAAAPQKIQTDVREKLSKKSVEENVFVPSNPVALEKAAAEIAKEKGFELNRGTSIGARLLARSRKNI